ncbi:hypothetical protein ACIQUZ_21900 [Streptomyces griseus]|uniref:Uncharacterized protein n=1 Tax=Streptomyces griseus subsp. griseus (strain JCM 4626 / CBS 651.72 / NBRC 13350 / KCC S-0626 / ISP 5235) TaxID=455632 RepID=B1VPC5_STRGG|nr:MULTISPECIES: hypothetical protein [Streptomyces]MYR51340.1 hypothetical protein [Streptomyces sp. SID4928]MYT81478.1 hypothetical protein [Streptomyces sp. SID8364]EGE43302.1 hypothetical protein SACT1_3972 [Streptomyces sp. ACT-1]MBW3706153.1 hypothetical protein [Streptomyces griseus]NEB52385.1 hypothetical protein [Streptomyces griseus]
MAQTIRPATGSRSTTGRRPTGSLFATDGRPHPVQDVLMVVTGVLGILAFVTAMFHHLHLISSWAGLVGILTGAYGQYISKTTWERFGLIMGLGASAVGFYLGMAHGGLFGGVIT